MQPTKQIQERLNYLRQEIEAERISYQELAELQSLTERKYWINGYQTRAGGKFKTLAISIFNLGIMICWGWKCNPKGYYKRFFPNFVFYKLI